MSHPLGFAATVLAAALAPSTLAAGQASREPAYSRTFEDCMDKAAGATPEMRDCVGAEQKRWDGALNAVYRPLLASLPPDRQARLRAQQRAWLRLKDHQCRHAGDAEAGGSLQPVEIDLCTLDETLRRALYLRLYQ